ncbi:unnamed protein product [Parnassius apollo]|uniref:(apollo) hypothetical protein n=1 Tax=Parnassius apollo TaxID=110799 RepID=A0A8S3Y0P3_PARAO|nr:unnamed protein product [Parnassius apollo]
MENQGSARTTSSPSHPSYPSVVWMSTGPLRIQQSTSATGGVHRKRWTAQMNENALRVYFRAKGGEVGGFAYRLRMHCFLIIAELEPSVTVSEQNLADRVRCIMRSKIFDDTELTANERLRRCEIVPPLDGNTILC